MNRKHVKWSTYRGNINIRMNGEFCKQFRVRMGVESKITEPYFPLFPDRRVAFHRPLCKVSLLTFDTPCGTFGVTGDNVFITDKNVSPFNCNNILLIWEGLEQVITNLTCRNKKETLTKEL